MEPEPASAAVNDISLGVHSELIVRPAHSTSPDDVPELPERLLMRLTRANDFELLEAVLAAVWTWMAARESLGTALGNFGQRSPLSFRRVEPGVGGF